MVRDFIKSRFPLSAIKKEVHMVAHLEFLLIIILLFFWTGCNPKKTNKMEEIPFNTDEISHSKWDDIFSNDEIIPFSFDNPDLEIYTIGDMLISPAGDYFILDGKARKVMQFDKEGKFIRFIGKYGEGPGEYALAACPYMDKYNNLYLYDVVRFRINKYTSPEYNFEKQIRMKLSIQDLLIDADNNIIIYTVSDPYILHQLDPKGNVIKKAFMPKKVNFRLFSARFQLGRLSNIPGRGFLASYPEEYKVYLFDYKLNIKKMLYTKTVSTYFPPKENFPNDLSPYDFTPGHAKWWGKYLKPSMVYYLGNGIFLKVLLKYTNLSARSFINLHDLNGNTYAKGVEVPFEGIIRYAGKDFYMLSRIQNLRKPGQARNLEKIFVDFW
jgi:hypothetical protein